MTKISDHNLIHRDVLEINQCEIEDKVYNLRQRHTYDNVFVSKGIQRGFTEAQLRSEYPDLEDKIFNSTEFHTGAYYMKRYMLDAFYNYLSDFHKKKVEDLDIVIASPGIKSKPIVEVSYYDQQGNQWLNTIDDVEVEHEPLQDTANDNVTSWQEDLANGVEELEPHINRIEDYELNKKSMSKKCESKQMEIPFEDKD
jgi:hypothetical protein|tara:strand:+ start:433 stop:1026 length:594 start_codon:yes stop_codon:yes gene_type:complete